MRRFRRLLGFLEVPSPRGEGRHGRPPPSAERYDLGPDYGRAGGSQTLSRCPARAKRASSSRPSSIGPVPAAHGAICRQGSAPGDAVYQRFRRWEKAGLWQALFAQLPDDLAAVQTLLFDSTVIRAHPHAAGARLVGRLEQFRGIATRWRGRLADEVYLFDAEPTCPERWVRSSARLSRRGLVKHVGSCRVCLGQHGTGEPGTPPCSTDGGAVERPHWSTLLAERRPDRSAAPLRRRGLPTPRARAVRTRAGKGHLCRPQFTTRMGRTKLRRPSWKAPKKPRRSCRRIAQQRLKAIERRSGPH